LIDANMTEPNAAASQDALAEVLADAAPTAETPTIEPGQAETAASTEPPSAPNVHN